MPDVVGPACPPALMSWAARADIGHMSTPTPHEPVTVVRALARRGSTVLMVRRAASDSLGGCWELPGGKVDAGDDHPVQALAREIREECGLHLCGTPRLIATTPRVSPRGTRLRELTFLADVTEGTERLSVEHDAVRWHPVDTPLPNRHTDAAADAIAALRERRVA